MTKINSASRFMQLASVRLDNTTTSTLCKNCTRYNFADFFDCQEFNKPFLSLYPTNSSQKEAFV